MTAQEQQMLQGLAERINRTELPEKDADAEQFIEQTLGRNPDALYVMAQTVLVQEYALDQAQKQLADLRGQLSQAQQHGTEPRHATSFLGNLLGRHDEAARPAAPPPPPVAAPVQYVGSGYGPGLAYPAGGYPIAGMPPVAGMPPQGGGFLRSAMETAAGVAAGALAFEGVESLMHGFGHSAGYGTDFAGPGYGTAGFGGEPREEVVNNYYGNALPNEHGGDLATSGISDGSHISSASDGNDGGTLHDASYVTGGAGDSTDATDDSMDFSANSDDSMLADDVGSQDAGSGFDSGADDSGGFDSGGDGGGDGGF